MHAVAAMTLRGTGLASCAALVAAGFVLASRSGEGAASLPSPTTRFEVVSVSATPTAEAPVVSVAAASPWPAEQPVPAADTPLAAAVTSAAPSVATPRPATTPAPTATPAVAADLPTYRDIQVLGFAANAVLPSGLTFRECIDMPPREEGWPAAVHLYYLGAGNWMVETHLAEVQVVFHEATDSFEVRNFQPTNPACR